MWSAGAVVYKYRGSISTCPAETFLATALQVRATGSSFACRRFCNPNLTSWPLPTKAQQSQYVNPHTVAGNAAVHSGQQAAPLTPMDPNSVAQVRSAFDNLINLLGQNTNTPRYQKAVQTMTQKLEQGSVPDAKHQMINDMCSALTENNMFKVNHIMKDFTSDSTFWNQVNHSKCEKKMEM